MYGTPAPAPRSNLGREAITEVPPASELSEHGLLSEEEVIAPRFQDHPTLPPRPAATATPSPSGPWLRVAVALAVSGGALALLATAFGVLVLLLWRTA